MLNIEELKEYIPLCWFKGDFEEMPESMSFFSKSFGFLYCDRYFFADKH